MGKKSAEDYLDKLLNSVNDEKTKKEKFSDYSFDYFDTVTTIIGFEESEEVFKKNCETIATTTGSSLRLRAEMSTDSRIIRSLEKGMELIVIANTSKLQKLK